MARDMDKFLTSKIGQVATFQYDDDGNFSGIEYITDPVTGEPLAGLDKVQLDADIDHWDQTFANHINEFGKKMDLEWSKLERLSDWDKHNKNKDRGSWVKDAVKGYFTYKGMTDPKWGGGNP